MKSESSDASRFVATAVAFEGALVVVALGLGWFLKRPPLAQIEWTVEGLGIGLVATLPLIAGLILITRYPVGPLKPLDELVRQWIVPLFHSAQIWHLFLISALAGVGEEFLFRGVVQAGIEQFSGSTWLALLAASLSFGLAHAISATYAMLAALVGAYLGWLFLAADNLFVPIVTHGAYDFLALLYLTRRGTAPQPPVDDETS